MDMVLLYEICIVHQTRKDTGLKESPITIGRIPKAIGQLLSLIQTLLKDIRQMTNRLRKFISQQKPNMRNCNMRGGKFPSKASQLSARTIHSKETSIPATQGREHQLAIA